MLVGPELEGEGLAGLKTRQRLHGRLADGSAVVISFEAKGVGKTLAALEHSRLAKQSQIAEVKTLWARHLEALT